MIWIILTLLYGFNKLMIIILKNWSNSSIWPIDGALTGSTSWSQSWPGSNGNNGVFHTQLKLIYQGSNDSTECFVFINIDTSFEDRASQWLFYEFLIWSWPKFFSSEKNQNMFSWKGCLNLFKSFSGRFFFLPFLAWELRKMHPFSSCLRNTKYLHAQTDW